MENSIQVKSLVKRYKDLMALNHFDIEIRKGELLALLGPNGCGKTTAINSMLGFLTFDSGEVTVLGESKFPLSNKARREIGIVPQDLAYLDNLTVEENKILAIVGPSGGGKTTLLRMLAGLEKIDSGEIIYNGESLPIDELEKRNLLGFVFQDFQLFPHLTVLENLVLSPIKTMNMSKEEAEQKALLLLEKLGLSKQINSYSNSLSGGQKQRVALARAMMINPKIIGYDEPTSALDPELRLEVEKLILQNKELGITQIVVTHDLQFAENIADSILKVEPK